MNKMDPTVKAFGIKLYARVHVALIENQFSNRVRLFLALLFNITEHAVQFGVLLVHLLQTFLGDPFLGFQIHKAAALPVQASLHVLRDAQKNTYGSGTEKDLQLMLNLTLYYLAMIGSL